MKKATVIIPAGGIGTRIGHNIPKQFINLNNIPMIIRTIQAFESSSMIENIIIGIEINWKAKLQELIQEYKLSKVKQIIEGGNWRGQTISNCLKQANHLENIILVHDAARPFVSNNLIEDIVDKTSIYHAVVPGLIPTDTIKIQSHNQIVSTPERNNLIAVQTPQGFSKDLLLKAYKNAELHNYKGTDDASLVEFLEEKVHVVSGEQNNIKITSELDLKISELILQN